MRRLLAAALAAAALGALPAVAQEPRALVVTPASRYVPGDACLVVASGGCAVASPVTTLVVPRGTGLDYLNLHPSVAHDVVSEDVDAEGRRLFRSEGANFRQQVPVEGVEALAPGTYAFFCSFHPGMAGALQIVG